MATNGKAHDEARQDLGAHAESYGGFISWMKRGTIISAVLAAFVIFLITR